MIGYCTGPVALTRQPSDSRSSSSCAASVSGHAELLGMERGIGVDVGWQPIDGGKKRLRGQAGNFGMPEK
jgi:hypothetical protein